MKMLLIKILNILMIVGISCSNANADDISLRWVTEILEAGADPVLIYDCGGYQDLRYVRGDLTAAFSMPLDQIKDVNVIHYSCDRYYQPFDLQMTLPSVYLRQFNKLPVGNVGRELAEYINGELVSFMRIGGTAEASGLGFGCFTLEKAVALSINLGFRPQYDSLCINEKKGIKDLSTSYKFKKKTDYKWENSVLWILSKDEELLNDLDEKKPLLKIQAKKIVEQYFNESNKDFERKGAYIRVVYKGVSGWIESTALISFLSTLDSNVFLQKFFENHEQFFNSNLINKKNSGAIEKRKAIRKLYVNEAKSRFLNDKEFEKWYLDTFNRPFQE